LQKFCGIKKQVLSIVISNILFFSLIIIDPNNNWLKD